MFGGLEQSTMNVVVVVAVTVSKGHT